MIQPIQREEFQCILLFEVFIIQHHKNIRYPIRYIIQVYVLTDLHLDFINEFPGFLDKFRDLNQVQCRNLWLNQIVFLVFVLSKARGGHQNAHKHQKK